MAKVFNWQLNRKMEYPYNQATPQRQFAAVFNINRCIGCQTCTMACKSAWTFSRGQEYMWWNNVETKPYGGYPRFWDARLLEMLGPQRWDGSTYEGKTIFEAVPAGEPALGYLPPQREWAAPNFGEDTSVRLDPQGTKLPEHTTWFFYLQRICNHCSYPACLAACPRKAIYKRPEDGIVLIDQNRCRGYQECMKACPYKKPMYRATTGVSEKCIACYPRVEENTVTRCIAACVGKIRLQGWVSPPEKARRDNPIDFLVHFEKVALPLYPQFGTEPNVYYIPPRWVPRGYLKQMFGPGVERALDRYKKPSRALLGVLMLAGSCREIISRYEVTAQEAIGYDADGKEVTRVPLEEEVIVRPEKHLNTT